MAKETVRREWRDKHSTRHSSSLSDAFTPMQLTSQRSRMMALGCIAIVSAAVGATVTGQVFAYKVQSVQQVAYVPQAPAAPEIETTTVIVAARPLRFGDKADASSVRATKWIAGTEPKGSFKTVDEFLANAEMRAVLSPIEEDEPILAAKVTGPGERATLASLVDDDKRAMTVAVDEVFGVAGFVLPGDRIDVILIRSLKAGDPDTSQSDIIAQNIKVLAIDQVADERLEVPNVSRAVTLEVDEITAQKLALGASLGRLSLTLRAAGSDHNSDQTPVSIHDLTGASAKRSSMNIIRGIGSGTATQVAAPATSTQAVQVNATTSSSPTEPVRAIE